MLSETSIAVAIVAVSATLKSAVVFKKQNVHRSLAFMFWNEGDKNNEV